MSKWTKWIAVAVLVALPTIGFAVTKYHSAHKACSSSHCPYSSKH